MSASATTMHAFIEQLAQRVPPEVHPSARGIIGEYLAEARSVVDDPAAVTCPLGKVRRRIVDELRWEAEKYASVDDHREAYKLRQRADRFEART